ncbi:peptide deformylase, partial [Alkalihalophilus pseudofirmus]
VIQHEIDHLNGIMFFDRINKENPFKLPENSKSLY